MYMKLSRLLYAFFHFNIANITNIAHMLVLDQSDLEKVSCQISEQTGLFPISGFCIECIWTWTEKKAFCIRPGKIPKRQCMKNNGQLFRSGWSIRQTNRIDITSPRIQRMRSTPSIRQWKFSSGFIARRDVGALSNIPRWDL